MNDALIHREDLKTLVEVGKALWRDPRESQSATLETLSAVSLLDLTPERAAEKAAAALLERVNRRGAAANFRSNLQSGLGASEPFYRLEPEERGLLVALHLGRWSYARLGRIYGESPEQIEALAWNSRVKLISMLKNVQYPAGASTQGPNCPDYDAHRPWTQRFLDEEIPNGRERVFFQNHLMACQSCRDALNRCREAYYAIERVMPRISPDEKGDAAILRSLHSLSRQVKGMLRPVERTFGETLVVFVQRRDVQIALLIFGLATVWKLVAPAS